MIRIQTYNSTPRRIQTGGINPGNQPALRTVSGRAEDRTLAAMLQSGLKLTDIAVKEYVSNETARVSQSLQQMNAELAAERERYMRENQGQNALNAGEHFENFARELAEKHLADGKFQGRFAQEFVQQAAGTALHFTEQGRSYAGQQRAAWQDSLLKGEISTFQNQVAQNYDNKDWIEFNLNNLTHRINEMRPGLDNRALLDDVRKDAAEGVIDGFLASGRVGDARGALAQYRDMLGDRANVVKVRIDARADALQTKAEAQRKKAEQVRLDALSADIWKDTEGLTWEKRREMAVEQIAARTEDPAERRKLLMLFDSDAEFQKVREEAADNRQARTFVEEARKAGLTPTQVLTQIDTNTDMTDRAKTLAWETFQGKIKESPANRAALVELRAEIDRRKRDGTRMSDDEIEAYGLNNGFTNEQIHGAYSYRDGGGKMGDITLSDLQKKWDALDGPKLPKDVDLYSLVESQIPDGKTATKGDLERILSNLVMDGEIKGGGWGYGKDTRNYEAILDETLGTWLPGTVSRQEREEGEVFLAEKGWPVTEELLHVYAKVRRGIPHNSISNPGDWPDFSAVQAARQRELPGTVPAPSPSVASVMPSSSEAGASPVLSTSEPEQVPSAANPDINYGEVERRKRQGQEAREEARRKADEERARDRERNRPELRGIIRPPAALNELHSSDSDMKHDYVVVFGTLPPSGMTEAEQEEAIRDRLHEDLKPAGLFGMGIGATRENESRESRLDYLKEYLKNDIRVDGRWVKKDWK